MDENLLFLIENGINDNVMGLIPHFQSKSPKYLDYKDKTGSVSLKYIGSDQPTVIPETGEFVVEPTKTNIAFNNTRIITDNNLTGFWVAGGNVTVLNNEDRLPYPSSETATTIAWAEGTGNPQKLSRTIKCNPNTNYSYWIIVKSVKNSIFSGSDILDVSGEINSTNLIRFEDLNDNQEKWAILEGFFETSEGSNGIAEITLTFYCSSLCSLIFGGLQIEEGTRTSFIPSIESTETLEKYPTEIIKNTREETSLSFNYWFPNLDDIQNYTISATLSEYKREGRLFSIEDEIGNKAIDVVLSNNMINTAIEGQQLNLNPITSFPLTIDLIVNQKDNSIIVCINGLITSQTSLSFTRKTKRKLLFSNIGLRKWKTFRIYNKALELSNTTTGLNAGGEIEENLKKYPFSIKNIVNRKKSFLIKSIIPKDSGNLFRQRNNFINHSSRIIQIYQTKNLFFESIETSDVISMREDVFLKSNKNLDNYQSKQFTRLIVEDGENFHIGKAYLTDNNGFIQEITIIEHSGDFVTVFPYKKYLKDIIIMQMEQNNDDIPLIVDISETRQGSYNEHSASYLNEGIFYIKTASNLNSFKKGKAYLRSKDNGRLASIYIIDTLSTDFDDYLVIDLNQKINTTDIFEDSNGNINTELIQFDFEAISSEKYPAVIPTPASKIYTPFNEEKRVGLYVDTKTGLLYSNGKSGDQLRISVDLEGRFEKANSSEVGLLFVDDFEGSVNGILPRDTNYLDNLLVSSRKERLNGGGAATTFGGIHGEFVPIKAFDINGDSKFLIYHMFNDFFNTWDSNSEGILSLSSFSPNNYFEQINSYISSEVITDKEIIISFKRLIHGKLFNGAKKFFYNHWNLKFEVIDVQKDPNDRTDTFEYPDVGFEYSKLDYLNNPNKVFTEQKNQFRSFRGSYNFAIPSAQELYIQNQPCYFRMGYYHFRGLILNSFYKSEENYHILTISFPAYLKNIHHTLPEGTELLDPIEIIIPNLQNYNHFLSYFHPNVPFNHQVERRDNFITISPNKYLFFNPKYSKVSFPFEIGESQRINNISPLNNEDYQEGLEVSAFIIVDNPSSFKVGASYVFDNEKNLLLGELEIKQIFSNPPQIKCNRVLSMFENQQLIQPKNNNKVMIPPNRYYANILNKDDSLKIVEKSSFFITVSNQGDEDKTLFASIDIL